MCIIYLYMAQSYGTLIEKCQSPTTQPRGNERKANKSLLPHTISNRRAFLSLVGLISIPKSAAPQIDLTRRTNLYDIVNDKNKIIYFYVCVSKLCVSLCLQCIVCIIIFLLHLLVVEFTTLSLVSLDL